MGSNLDIAALKGQQGLFFNQMQNMGLVKIHHFIVQSAMGRWQIKLEARNSFLSLVP